MGGISLICALLIDNIKVSGGVENDVMAKARKGLPVRWSDWLSHVIIGGETMTLILAIDPGLSGGIAWQDDAGKIHAKPMPEDMTSQADLIREIVGGHSLYSAIMERTGTYVPGNSSPAAVTFARHCGNLEAILYKIGRASCRERV